MERRVGRRAIWVCALVGIGGHAGVGTLGRAGPRGRAGGEQDAAPLSSEWLLSPWLGQGRWYPSVVLLPPSSVTPESRLPGEAVVGLRQREDGVRIEAFPGATPGERLWSALDRKRPRILGRFEGAVAGTEELEVEVPRGETIGSAMLVSGDGFGLRLAFREVGSTPERWPHPAVRVAIEKLAAPPGVYNLILATGSGVPSAGELVVIGVCRPPGEEEEPEGAQGSTGTAGDGSGRAEWPPRPGR